jgi:hypothetical protein
LRHFWHTVEDVARGLLWDLLWGAYLDMFNKWDQQWIEAPRRMKTCVTFLGAWRSTLGKRWCSTRPPTGCASNAIIHCRRTGDLPISASQELHFKCHHEQDTYYGGSFCCVVLQYYSTAYNTGGNTPMERTDHSRFTANVAIRLTDDTAMGATMEYKTYPGSHFLDTSHDPKTCTG